MDQQPRILHLLDALTHDRRERGALLYELRDFLEVYLHCREEICAHGVRAVLGSRCARVKAENARVREGFGRLVTLRDDEGRFVSAVRDLRRTIEAVSPTGHVLRHAA